MDQPSGGVQSVERIFIIVEILAAAPKGIALLEIAKRAQLAKSTTHRLLSSLTSLGYVVQDNFSSHYRLTLKMFELSSNIVNDMDVVSAARPYLDDLSRRTGEAVHLVVRNGAYIVYVYKAQAGSGRAQMSSHVGLRAPMYCTGVGKAILATLPQNEIEGIWNKSKIEPLTNSTITELPALMQQLELIRARGWATDDEENELGIRCVAVALPELSGKAQAAFSVSGLAPQMSEERCEEIALMSIEAERQILHGLGR